MNQTAIIMSRVLFLYRLKRLAISPWSKFFVFLTLTVVGLSLVSVTSVLHNWWNGGAHPGYLFSAAWHTGLTAQLILAAFVLFGLALLRPGLRYFHPGKLFAF